MLKFFDFKSEMGRLDYFKSFVFRVLIFAFITGVIGIVEFFLSGGSSFDTATSPPPSSLDSWESFVELSNDPNTYIDSLKTGFISLLLIGPIELRRANDLRLNYKWLVPVLFAFLIPSNFNSGLSIGLMALLVAYNVVLSLILLFKPGQAHKDYIRSKE